MAVRWAISGVDLHLHPLGPRVRAGLEDALRDAILDGRLAADTRLPSSRALAADLGIARNTVVEAYSTLVAEGWLLARQGSGTRVARRPPRGAADARTGSGGGARVPALPHNLRPGSPDLAAFPRAAWLAAARRALAAAPADALGYDAPEGRPELRTALAEYLGRARGVIADPERIVVCAGFGHALALVCAALHEGGARTLAAERFGLPDHRWIAARSGLRLRTLGVDERGARVEELAEGPAPDAALLTPAHQFPLGGALAPERRAAAARWAAAGDHVLIEDDYDGEFRYDRQPVGAMQALAPEHVVYVGTTSKSLAPGLRIAWLVLGTELHARVHAAQTRLRAAPGVIEQLTLAQLLTSGAYDRQVRRARLAYRRRRDRLVATLARDAPEVRVRGIAAGLHALIELPDGASEEDVIARAAGHGLELSGLRRFTEGGRDGAPAGPPALVIGYGSPPEHGYTAALARLAAVLAAGGDARHAPGPRTPGSVRPER